MIKIYLNKRQKEICELLESWGITHRHGQDLIRPYWRVEVAEWSNKSGEMCRGWWDVGGWSDQQLELRFKPEPEPEISPLKSVAPLILADNDMHNILDNLMDCHITAFNNEDAFDEACEEWTAGQKKQWLVKQGHTLEAIEKECAR